MGYFLTIWTTISFSREPQLHRVSCLAYEILSYKNRTVHKYNFRNLYSKELQCVFSLILSQAWLICLRCCFISDVWSSLVLKQAISTVPKKKAGGATAACAMSATTQNCGMTRSQPRSIVTFTCYYLWRRSYIAVLHGSTTGLQNCYVRWHSFLADFLPEIPPGSLLVQT
jgi:hypothetical protein